MAKWDHPMRQLKLRWLHRLALTHAKRADAGLYRWYLESKSHDKAQPFVELLLVVVDGFQPYDQRVARLPGLRVHGQQCQDHFEPSGLCPLASSWGVWRLGSYLS